MASHRFRHARHAHLRRPFALSVLFAGLMAATLSSAQEPPAASAPPETPVAPAAAPAPAVPAEETAATQPDTAAPDATAPDGTAPDGTVPAEAASPEFEQPEIPGVTVGAKAVDGDAEILPKALSSILLDVEDTGAGLIAVGERGHVLLSADGAEWRQSKAPTRATLTAVDCADAKNCWAVGHDAVILYSADGGKTWTKQAFEPDLEKPYLDVMFFDAQHGFVIGAYGLFKETLDGGKSWNEFNADIRLDEWHFNAIRRLGNGTLLLVGETGGIATSVDSGVTWVRQESPYEGSYFAALPIGESGAVIFGLRGNAYISADAVKGGWTKLETGTFQGLLGGTTLPNGDFIMVGNAGTILRGNSAGELKQIPDPVGKPIGAAAALANGDLLLLGETGAHIIKGAAQ